MKFTTELYIKKFQRNYIGGVKKFFVSLPGALKGKRQFGLDFEGLYRAFYQRFYKEGANLLFCLYSNRKLA